MPLALILAESEVVPASVYSALLLTRAHKALVKSRLLYREWGPIWDGPLSFSIPLVIIMKGPVPTYGLASSLALDEVHYSK